MWFVLLTHIHWIAIYPVDNVIQPLNNWGQKDIFCSIRKPSVWKLGSQMVNQVGGQLRESMHFIVFCITLLTILTPKDH